MKVTLILLMALVDHAVSNTPYCVFDYPKSSYINGINYLYTCSIRIDGKLTVPNKIWATHDLYPERTHSDVFVLSVADQAKKFINIFPSVYCDKFKSLKIIDMSEVDIATVKRGALKNCKELNILIFYKNKIQVVYKNLLINNPGLTDVHLSYNKFRTLHQNLFLKQKNLKTLELSFNYINFLPNKIFYSQINLETLKLDGNNLKYLNSDWFESLQNLKELDLSYNEIEDLPKNVFNPLQSLRKLNLNSNKISFIKSASFGHHSVLSDVIMSENKLFGIDREFIEKIPVKKLNMKGNTCSNEILIHKREMDEKLQLCYEYFGNSYGNIDLTTTPKIITKNTRRNRTRSPMTKSPGRNMNECGTRPAGIPLVSKGEDFNPGTYPWMAVLINNKNNVHCGGVLISKRKVLTAGHCIYDKSKRKYENNYLRVVLGSHDLSEIFEVSRVTANIESIKTHDHWNPETPKYDSDIAVIVLKYEVEFNDRVWPICLPNKNKIVETINMGTVVGYGKTEDRSKEFSTVPKQAQTPIHRFENCLREYPELHTIASRTTFCGGHANGTGACTGDSGGGLFVSYKNVFYLRGLVSSSLIDANIGCDVNKYSIYTNVTRFIGWINKIPVSQISSRFGDAEDEEDEEYEEYEGNFPWDKSSTLRPPSVNDTDVDFIEVVVPVPGAEYNRTTYEKGRIWS